MFGSLYMHNLDDKRPTRPGFELNTTRHKPGQMNRRGRPAHMYVCLLKRWNIFNINQENGWLFLIWNYHKWLS